MTIGEIKRMSSLQQYIRDENQIWSGNHIAANRFLNACLVFM